MTAVIDFLYKILKNFIAWTTAAVDNVRVIGAIPIVMDLANFQKVRNVADIFNKVSLNFNLCVESSSPFSSEFLKCYV